jgi:hypothetical protein
MVNTDNTANTQQLDNVMHTARVALIMRIRQGIKNRHGFPAYSRKGIREDLRAYRVLSNVLEVNATFYTFDESQLHKVKKALAK